MFGKLSENLQKFIYFDGSTQGQSGKKVFIDPMLLPKYMDYVENFANTRETTIAAIKQLSATAGSVTSSKNLQTAHLHRSHCGTVVVTYLVLQDKIENSHGPGVYITDVAQAVMGESEQGPGFYRINNVDEGWRSKELETDTMPTLIGTIGSVYNNDTAHYSLKSTQNKIGDFLDRRAAKHMTGEGFALYYSPSYTVDGYGTWLPSKQQTGSAGPDRLANILINTQKQYWGDIDSPHLWYVFGDGATLLSKALDVVERRGIKQLNYHSFEFIDPTVNMVKEAKRLESLGSVSRYKNLDFISTRARFHQFTGPASATTGLEKSSAWEKSLATIKAGQNQLQNVVESKLPIVSANIDAYRELTFTALTKKFVSMTTQWNL
ncbi:hypothetical protein L1F30_00125 [Simiduia sp. 21SJ11W-1]|uniref:hypothetical protein n=1 Tax=Simiduia sp. 21SJ11W-1 TaxID=2909669 RepID=UPI0020A07055|nr:hypothetical protein [Simiduia sp. 21SJ11W-1]UTA47964.1 hypothetical protein L1F30_00125 [Simiduia sp. 21SJ11W-1]